MYQNGIVIVNRMKLFTQIFQFFKLTICTFCYVGCPVGEYFTRFPLNNDSLDPTSHISCHKMYKTKCNK